MVCFGFHGSQRFFHDFPRRFHSSHRNFGAVIDPALVRISIAIALVDFHVLRGFNQAPAGHLRYPKKACLCIGNPSSIPNTWVFIGFSTVPGDLSKGVPELFNGFHV